MFVVTLPFFSCNALNAIPLKYVSMNNQECRIRLEIIILTVINLYFILTVFRLISVVITAIISMIHMQNYVFLMLLKT